MSHANRQFKELMKVKEMIQDMGFVNLTHHISATSGFLVDQKKNWGSSLLRLGIGMYGLWPSESLRKKFKRKIKLKPVMRWVTKLAQVKTVPKDFPVGYGLTFVTKKETKIAVVPQGYSDGYDRRFSNNSFVLIRDKKCPVIGRVAMNMFVVDVSNISDVRLEDEVVLLDNSEKSFVSADSLAKRIGVINYEIFTHVSPLLERVII